MTSIDNRIVSIKFDNSLFESKIEETIKSLEALTKALEINAGVTGIQNVGDAMSDIPFERVEAAIDSISNKFTAMGAVGFTVIQDLTRSIINMGTSLVDRVMAPISSGGMTRALNMEAAKFQFRGLGMDIEKGMKSANDAVLGTAYGLDVAAKTAAQLGASGMAAGDDMTTTLRGIAGAAAMANTSFEDISQIYTTAAASGKVSGYELSRFSIRGLNAAAALGKQLGVTEAEVRNMASSGKLSFEVFAKAMDDAFGEHAQKANETYTGSLANMMAAFGRIGADYKEPMLAMKRDLFNSITPALNEVRSALTPVIDMFLFISRIRYDAMIAFFDNLDFKGIEKGMPNIAKGMWNIFAAAKGLGSALLGAFREVFPKRETSLFLDFSKRFVQFTERIKMEEGTLKNVGRIFKGVFSVIKIGLTIFKEFGKVAFEALRGLFSGFEGGDALEKIADFADKISDLRERLVEGGGIARAFEDVGAAIAKVTVKLKSIMAAVREFTFDKIVSGSGEAKKAFDKVGGAVGVLTSIWGWFLERTKTVRKIARGVIAAIAAPFVKLADTIKNSIKTGDFSGVLDALNTALFGGLILLIRKFMKDGLSIDFTGGFIEGVTGALESLTGTLEAMQAKLKAEALFTIAKAIGVITVSLLVLSLIDPAALSKALGAVSVAMGELIGAMAIIAKFDPRKLAGLGAVSASMIGLASAILILSLSVAILSRLSWQELGKGLAGVAGGLATLIAAVAVMQKINPSGLIRTAIGFTALGAALLVLVIPMKIFSKMDWEELGKGLAGVAGGLALLIGAAQLIKMVDPKKLISTGISFLFLSASMVVMAKALKSFSDMEWSELGKGLAGAAASLLVLVLALRMLPKDVGLKSVGVLILSAALIVMAEAVKSFADIGWGDLAKGLISVVLLLAAVSAALNAIPPTAIISAVGVLVSAKALGVLAEVVGVLGNMSLGSLITGIAALAVMLIGMVAAMNAMNSAIGGAVAMVIAAQGLKALTEVVERFGNMKISTIITGLVGLAAGMALFGGLGALLGTVSPLIAAFGASMLLVGAGLILVGGGILAAAKGFEILSKSSRVGIKAVIGILEELIKLVPKLVAALARGVIEGITTILDGLPELIGAFKEILVAILEAVREILPELFGLIGEIISGSIQLIRDHGPDMIAAGFEFLTAFILGLNDNVETLTNSVISIILKIVEVVDERMGEITAVGARLLASFITGIADNIGDIVLAVIDLIVKFTNAVSERLGLIIDAGIDLLVNFISGVSDNLSKVTDAVVDLIAQFIKDVADGADDLMKSGTEALEKFLEGVGNYGTRVGTAASKLLVKFMYSISDNLIYITESAFNVVIKFIRELARVIDEKSGELRDAGKELAEAVADGATLGFYSKAKGLAKTAKDVFVGGPVRAVAGIAGWALGSPSRRMRGIAEDIADGFVIGIDTKRSDVGRSMKGMSNEAYYSFVDSFKSLNSALDYIKDLDPVITPTLDLSSVESEADRLSSLLGSMDITPDSLFGGANTIVKLNDRREEKPQHEPTQPTEIKFEQNIHSPEQLSVDQIYRNTKSQIALAKEELGVK